MYPSDTSTGNFKHSQITQSLDIERKKKKKDQTAKKEKKESSSSSGLTLDYTKMRDVFRLLTEEMCFQRRFE